MELFYAFWPFNWNWTNEDKAFAVALEVLIMMFDLICSGWDHAWIAISWGYSLDNWKPQTNQSTVHQIRD